MPDDLFSPWGEVQVPPMASAATVRARGDRRRRRSQAVLAGAGALVVALALTGGLALAGGGRQVVQPGTPVPSSSAPTPPTSEATPTGEPAPSTAPSYELADAAFTPEDLARVEAGAWDYLDVVTDDGLLLDPCPGGTTYPSDVDRVARSSAGLVLLREAGGTEVVQQLARYVDVTAATEAFDGYRRAVEGCPVKPVEGLPDQVFRHEVLESSDDDGLRSVLVRAKTGCDASCAGGAFYLGFSYFAVQQVGDAVVLTRVAVGEDGDPGLDDALPFFAAAQDRLRDTVG